MPRKVRKCIICSAPTVADNRLCKRRECHEQRAIQRINVVKANDRGPPASGTFMSLKNCVHGVSLLADCYHCDDDWEKAQNDFDDDETSSNPRIKYAIKL